MYFKKDDTICAPATTPGTGAISVIRMSGPDAFDIADSVIKCRKGTIGEAPGYTIRFGTVTGRDGKLLDEVLVSVFRAPHSYTGENSVEISCHASSYIATELMALLVNAGARMASPGEFTERAFLNGKMDLAQAEAVADLISAQSAVAHRVAFNQMKGGFSNELREMRSGLLELVSLMELELDFSEEEVEFADREKLRSLLDRTVAHVERLMESFRLGNAIKNGVPVAIAGATNTGKSTLLNALLGEDRAIVSDVHGTTRDTIEETMNIDGVLFRFIDTAGLRETSEVVEQIGIERTYKKINSAQIILVMVDATAQEDIWKSSLRSVVDSIDFASQTPVFLVNKADLVNSAGNDYVKGGNSAVNIFVNIHNYIVSLLKDKGVISDSTEFDSRFAFLPISAKKLLGIDALRTHLSTITRSLKADSETTLVTNLRHYEALAASRTSLLRAGSGLDDGIPTDLVSQDIRETIYTLGTIVGEISSDEVLGNIFKNFCIGK